ncbi:MAG: ABC transporter substrate-binding protein [Eubacteriaceae bacterium]|nr:ABC transporter substrate-binding protein [Eubacteriaceae bacterium]
MKKFIAVLLVCLLSVSVFGCGGGSGKGDDDAAVIKIGGIGPLTGDYATYGVSVKNGAQIAVDEINEAGGVNGFKFELLFEDDQADPEKAVNAYAKLIDDGMNVSLGCVTSGACVAVTEEIKKDGLLMLTPSGSQLECTQYDNCFRVCFQDPDQGKYSADFIKEKAVGTKVAIIYDKSNPYSVGIYDSFIAEAEAVGLEVVTAQAFTDQSNTDFSVQLQAVKGSGADLLFLPIYAQEAAYILTQADAIDLDVIFFGVDGMDGILEKIGEDNIALTEGVMLLTPFAADSQDEKVVNFVTKYKAAYNMTPDQFAADGYDAIYIIKAAIEQAGITEIGDGFNEALVAAMVQITVDGVTGSMQWTADGEPAKNATAVVIKDGVYVAFE